MKGLSPIVSMVMVIAFGFAAMTIVLTVVNPLLDTAKDAGLVNEATQNMQLVDSAIKAVASEAKGSKRTIHVKITEGVLRTDDVTERVFFEYEPKTRNVLEGFEGDIKIESRAEFLDYFNQYNDNAFVNSTWTSINGTWSISSGRFLGNGGIAYHNFGTKQEFDIGASVVTSSQPHGQVYIVPGDPRSLVLYFPFDENVNNSVTTAYDFSAYKNNGTLSNATSATCNTSNACPVWVGGKTNNATDFDGVGDYINVTASSNLNFSTALSIGVWVYAKTFPSGSPFVLAKENGAFTNGFDIYITSAGVPHFRLHDGTANDLFGTSTLSANTWYYITATWDGSTMAIYVNGAQENTTSATGVLRNSSTNLIIGSRPALTANALFNGTIDEVMIFNRALTANEVAFLYESSTKKITPGGEIPSISADENVTMVLASPGGTYFDNVKFKTGPIKIKFIVPYQNMDIVNVSRYGPGDHNIVIRHYGINSTSSRPMIGLEE